MPDEAAAGLLSEGSPSVQVHLGILQGVIERMASNSSSAKAWCIATVSATLVVVADKGKPDYALLALIPTFLFFSLDAYYLAMEKGFRRAYNSFVQKVHEGTLEPADLYCVEPEGQASGLQWEALRSFSVWGFYLVLGIVVVLAWGLLLR